MAIIKYIFGEWMMRDRQFHVICRPYAESAFEIKNQ